MKKIMFVMPLLALSFLASCNNGGNKPEPKLNRWYTYEDWWNYCSNGKADSEAIKEDVGKEVNLTVNGKVHKIRLIDTEHDDLAESNGKAKCTFEFVNLLTDNEGNPIETVWDNSSTHYNFPGSTLNKYLNGVDGDITGTVLEMLPENLRNSIKVVNKKVGIGETYDTDTPYPAKLFPLSVVEIGGSEEDFVPKGEGTVYLFYQNGIEEDERRIKSPVNDINDSWYWLRSPWTGGYNDNVFDVMSNFGCLTINSITDNEYMYIAPAFCI